jgi:hypothetical protein
VRTLVKETFPLASAPPGKSADFQARAGFISALKDPKGISTPQIP